jgi:ubiquinone/menaquinone biosynthesis C-methylase UbiE
VSNLESNHSYEISVEDINRNYAESSANVRARFEVYSYAYPYIELEDKAISTLRNLGKLPLGATVLDVGTADAALHERLVIEHGHEGEFWGIDPNTKQFAMLTNLIFSPEDWLSQKQSKRELPIDLDQMARMQEQGQQYITHMIGNLILREGRAENLDFIKDNSVDALFAMFMLYHLSSPARQRAFTEFTRVTKEDGVVIVATSGSDNKQMHRLLEQAIAGLLNIQAPQPMNTGFTTEKAKEELPTHFNHVYMFNQKSEIQIRDNHGIEVYLRSLRSLRDQFKPIPSEDDYNNALNEIIMPVLREHIHENGVFIDKAHRTIALCTSKPLPGIEKHSFTSI